MKKQELSERDSCIEELNQRIERVSEDERNDREQMEEILHKQI